MLQHSMVCMFIFILAMLLAVPAGAYMSKLYTDVYTRKRRYIEDAGCYVWSFSFLYHYHY